MHRQIARTELTGPIFSMANLPKKDVCGFAGMLSAIPMPLPNRLCRLPKAAISHSSGRAAIIELPRCGNRERGGYATSRS